ncbi:hypothetical protein THAOC_05434 [Thalassiosira oceanica]|uniref:Uncharacterized protein n=1 Tax=Thalassiosira oceanica TaxID=159749 RepID=K0TMT9_THAOC|nr:hypothetical protein THAOC_05434 [Thalassiosira oceanica]|eukprot:EJK72977.1 hypothetical protein THAOC_05434 [Thalassiosira oceanica]
MVEPHQFALPINPTGYTFWHIHPSPPARPYSALTAKGIPPAPPPAPTTRPPLHALRRSLYRLRRSSAVPQSRPGARAAGGRSEMVARPDRTVRRGVLGYFEDDDAAALRVALPEDYEELFVGGRERAKVSTRGETVSRDPLAVAPSLPTARRGPSAPQLCSRSLAGMPLMGGRKKSSVYIC